MDLINLERKSNRDVVLFSFFIGILATFVNGYKYGLGNHIEHLPMIFRLLDKTYLVKDFFVNASAGFGSRFYYSRLFAFLGAYLPLPVVFLSLTLFSNMAVCFITYRVARNLFAGSNFIAMIASALVCVALSVFVSFIHPLIGFLSGVVGLLTVGIFRLVARKAIVVDYKGFPHSVDSAMVEWKERLSDCYGQVQSTGFAAGDDMDWKD